MDIVTLAASRKYTDKKIAESASVGIKYKIVDSLPSSGETQTIYFVNNDNGWLNNYYDEYLWISSSGTFEKIGSTQLDDFIQNPSAAEVGQTIVVKEVNKEGKPITWEMADLPEQVQSDWNQNDETAPDYVKNRPFYTGDLVETEIIPKTTVAFTEESGIMAAIWPESFDFVDGQTYKISWDGTDYVCAGILFNNIKILGNFGLIGGADTGEPFIFVNQDEWYVGSTESATEHVIGISEFGVEVVKIDSKYLPTATNDIPGISKLAIRVIDTEKDYTTEEVKEIFKNIHFGLAIYYLNDNCIGYARCDISGSDRSDYIIFYFVSGRHAEFTPTSGIWNFNNYEEIPPSTIPIYHELGEVEMCLSYDNVGGYKHSNMPAVGCDFLAKGFVGDYIQADSALVLKMNNAAKYLWIDADSAGGLYVHTRKSASTSDLSKTQIAMISDVPTEDHINELINNAVPTDDHINGLINAALGVIENGSY